MQTFNGRFIKPIQQNQHKIDPNSLKKKLKIDKHRHIKRWTNKVISPLGKYLKRNISKVSVITHQSLPTKTHLKEVFLNMNPNKEEK